MKRNTLHRRAQRATSLVGKHCNRCDSTRSLQRHHPDYRRPLFVEILCASCHNKHHQGVSEKTCKICSVKFTPDRNRRVMCGAKKCRSEHGRRSAAKRWRARRKTKECAWCGKRFRFTKARQMHCSRSCGNRSAWMRRRARASTSFGLSATEWFRWSSHMRSELSRLGSEVAP